MGVVAGFSRSNPAFLLYSVLFIPLVPPAPRFNDELGSVKLIFISPRATVVYN